MKPSLKNWMILVVAASIGTETAWSQVAGDEVRRLVATEGSARVIVALRSSSLAAASLAQQRTATQRSQDRVLAGLTASEFSVTHRYQSAPALAGTVSAAGLAKLLASPDVKGIDVDPIGSTLLSESVPQIRADVVQDDYFLDGTGVTVAVIDTGIDTDHANLVSSVGAEACFCFPDCCPAGGATQFGPGAAEDGNDHGSHCSGIITSDGVIQGRGVAPGATIVSVKIFKDAGGSGYGSDFIAALDWILNNAPSVKVISMSIQFGLYTGVCDNDDSFTMSLSSLAASLRSNGVLLVGAAGNNGSITQIVVPACLSDVTAVGAVTKTDGVAAFSNSTVDVDLLAPGVFIWSSTHNGGVAPFSGTSMATPHVAGLSALLMQSDPTATPAEIHDAMVNSGILLTDPKSGITTPRINATAALSALNCGDGVLDIGQTCDDGNQTSGDGCSAICQIEPCWQCSGEPSVCSDTPRPICRFGYHSKVLLKDMSTNSKDLFKWKWKGQATSLNDFGDPVDGETAYDVCVYDQTAGVHHLAFHLRVPPGGTCADGAPCWKKLGNPSSPTGYMYLDKDLTSQGAFKVLLKPGVEGRAKALVIGKGGLLPLPGPSTPFAYFDQQLEVAFQLHRSDDANICWEKYYSQSLFNGAQKYLAKYP